mgnify:CR=1 FL=1
MNQEDMQIIGTLALEKDTKRKVCLSIQSQQYSMLLSQ